MPADEGLQVLPNCSVGSPDSRQPDLGFPDSQVKISDEPPGSSRISGNGDSGNESGICWKSIVIGKDVMECYVKQVGRLQIELKEVSLDDHEWILKSWDQDGVGIVKLHCVECRKDCGSDSGNHNNSVVAILFSNFKNSHLASTQHIRNWCRKHNVSFFDHPASVVGKEKPVPLSPSKHKELIDEGASIVRDVNLGLLPGVLPFTVVGDVEIPNPKSFWFKVKCPYCRDLLSLCPPKKNLEANLENHIAGSKHMVAVEEANAKHSKSTALLSGRPSRSGSTSAHSNQPDLHSWLTGATGGSDGDTQTK